MTYKLEQIEGIGPFFAARLQAAGVSNSDELLARCSTDEGRRRLADSCAVSVGQLTTWMHQADLMRVSGIGSEFGQLLEVSGVESVEQLSARDPENVAHLLHRVNSERRLTRTAPSIKTVAKWIERARAMTFAHTSLEDAQSDRHDFRDEGTRQSPMH
jgi:predicted flap endonuclease-1-like 5' DNA nuclease